MDGVSIAASIVGIAGAGVQISIKLVTLATQISTASERVSSIGNDISLTAGVLHQLGELMTQKTTEDGVSIFSKGGLETTRTSAAMCERIFQEVGKEVKRASEQLRGCKRMEAGKIKLSKVEKAKWPFLQPSVDILRTDLREAKGTLMLMLQVTSLALSKRMADINQSTSANQSEQRDFMRAIVAIQQQQYEQKAAEQKDRSKRSSSSSVDKLIIPPKDNRMFRLGSLQPSVLPVRVKPHRNTIHSTPMRPTLSTYSETNRSKNINFASIPDVSISAFHLPSLTGINDTTLWSDKLRLPQAREGPSRAVQESQDGGEGRELQLFLIKPIVKDYFDKIELTWSLHNTRMQQMAIRNFVTQHEVDGMPSVVDMIVDLHAYEQAMIDTELQRTGAGSEAMLLALKRTKSRLRHREITLTDVPGLQFVVERSPMVNRSQFTNPPMMQMRGSGPLPITNHESSDNDALQDYQRQMLQLEQQNKMRLLIARREQQKQDEESRTISTPGDLHTTLGSFDMGPESHDLAVPSATSTFQPSSSPRTTHGSRPSDGGNQGLRRTKADEEISTHSASTTSSIESMRVHPDFDKDSEKSADLGGGSDMAQAADIHSHSANGEPLRDKDDAKGKSPFELNRPDPLLLPSKRQTSQRRKKPTEEDTSNATPAQGSSHSFVDLKGDRLRRISRSKGNFVPANRAALGYTSRASRAADFAEAVGSRGDGIAQHDLAAKAAETAMKKAEETFKSQYDTSVGLLCEQKQQRVEDAISYHSQPEKESTPESPFSPQDVLTLDKAPKIVAPEQPMEQPEGSRLVRERGRDTHRGDFEDITFKFNDRNGRYRDEIIIRRPEWSPSLKPIPEPVREPEPVKAPAIFQDIITHHHHIDHGKRLSRYGGNDLLVLADFGEAPSQSDSSDHHKSGNMYLGVLEKRILQDENDDDHIDQYNAEGDLLENFDFEEFLQSTDDTGFSFKPANPDLESYEENETGEAEEAEEAAPEDEDTIVNGLLGKYTTIFD